MNYCARTMCCQGRSKLLGQQKILLSKLLVWPIFFVLLCRVYFSFTYHLPTGVCRVWLQETLECSKPPRGALPGEDNSKLEPVQDFLQTILIVLLSLTKHCQPQAKRHKTSLLRLFSLFSINWLMSHLWGCGKIPKFCRSYPHQHL